MTSEGWTLVNFKMFSAKACMNRVFSTEAFIKRGFLKPFVLNHVAIRVFCFTRIVLIFLKTRCFIKKSRQSHELEPKHPPLHNFVLRRSSFKRSCCLSKASAFRRNFSCTSYVVWCEGRTVSAAALPAAYFAGRMRATPKKPKSLQHHTSCSFCQNHKANDPKYPEPEHGVAAGRFTKSGWVKIISPSAPLQHREGRGNVSIIRHKI